MTVLKPLLPLLCVFLLAAVQAASQAPNKPPVTMRCGRLLLQFAPDTGGIAAVRNEPEAHNFIAQPDAKPLLWRLVMHDPTGKETFLDNRQVPAPAIRQDGRRLTLEWVRLDLPGEPGAMDVRVICSPSSAPDMAQMQMQVTNRSRAVGLWQVQFPVISPLSSRGAPDIAVPRDVWGKLYPKAADAVVGSYPSNNLPMQFMLLNEGEDGLYLAAQDPTARPKELFLAPGGEFRVVNPVDDMGVPGSGWKGYYPFALGVYRGNWLTGSKIYRAWALGKTPWARKGPIATRADFPASIRRTCAWFNGSGTREEAVPAVRKFADAIGAPSGVHWYSWHVIPFDTDYPAYFPAKPGFAEGVRELEDAGVLVMPYINARLWDSANKEFPEARPHTCKDQQGNPLIEEYGSGAKLAVMCPSQAFWQERVGQIVRRLATEEGVNAVYLDQIGSAGPRFCFDKSHGHPLGSGSWWVDGYRKMLTPIKRWCTSNGRSVALTTENNAEPYMDNVDGFLIWTPRSQDDVPMITAVYSGYTLYFASNHAMRFGDPSYCLLQARDVVWGTEPGWDGGELLAPANAGKLEYIGRMARLRSRSLDYLATGELLDVLKAENAVPEIEGRWDSPGGDAPVRLPAVQAALWRARDGSYAVILANADTSAHPYRVTIDMDRYAPGHSASWQLSRVSAEGTQPLPDANGRQVTVETEVPARDGIAVIIRPR